MGYRNPVITHHFRDLVDEGDDVYVTIRNPKIMAPGELTSEAAEIRVGEDGKPVADERDIGRSYKLAAKIIVGWRMYDATFVPPLDDQGEPLPGADWPLLPVKPSAEDVAKAPMDVITWIAGEIGKINPQLAPAIPEATSTPSLPPPRASTTAPGPGTASSP